MQFLQWFGEAVTFGQLCNECISVCLDWSEFCSSVYDNFLIYRCSNSKHCCVWIRLLSNYKCGCTGRVEGGAGEYAIPPRNNGRQLFGTSDRLSVKLHQRNNHLESNACRVFPKCPTRRWLFARDSLCQTQINHRHIDHLHHPVVHFPVRGLLLPNAGW